MDSKRKAASTVALMVAATALSKILGLCRSMLMAYIYGDSTEAAAFVAASRVPLNIFDILLAAAILGCFIPAYNSFSDDEKGRREADGFASSFLNIILLATGALSLLGIIFSRPLLSLLVPGLDGEALELAVRLLRIMFPMIISTGAAFTLTGIHQSAGRYVLPAFMSLVSNLGVVLYLLFINPSFGITGLAWAYSVSWLLQLFTLLVPLAPTARRYSLTLTAGGTALKRALRSSLPIMVGSWLIPAGGMAAQYFSENRQILVSFEYANQVYMLAAGILTYGICNFLFPQLSRLSGRDDRSFSAMVREGMLSTLLVVTPVAAGMLVLRGEAVAVLFMRGAFGADAARLSSQALLWLVPGMLAFSAIEVLSRVYYAKGLARFPMLAAAVGITVNLICSYISVRVRGGGISALAASNAAGQIAAALLLFLCSSRYLNKVFDRKFHLKLCSILASGLIALAVMYALHALISGDIFGRKLVNNILISAAVLAAGLAVYLLCAALTGALDVRILKRRGKSV